jgi:hypothetical protein
MAAEDLLDIPPRQAEIDSIAPISPADEALVGSNYHGQ